MESRRFVDAETSSDEDRDEKRDYKSGRALLRSRVSGHHHQLSPKPSPGKGEVPRSSSVTQPISLACFY